MNSNSPETSFISLVILQLFFGLLVDKHGSLSLQTQSFALDFLFQVFKGILDKQIIIEHLRNLNNLVHLFFHVLNILDIESFALLYLI